MKKPIRFLKGTAIALALLTIGCSDDLALDNTQPTAALPEDDGITYPHSPSFHPTVLSRSGSSFEEDWENWDKYTLGSGTLLPLPWSTDAKGSNDTEVKKNTGWIMVAHNLKSVYTQEITPPFIIFYNEYSGELKVMYHVYSAPKSGEWSTAYVFPILSFNKPNSLLNSVSQIALDNTIRPSNYQWVTNPRGNSIGLVDGWNSIVIPLSYDPTAAQNDISLKVDMSKLLNQGGQNFYILAKWDFESGYASADVYNNFFVKPSFNLNNEAAKSYISTISTDISDTDFQQKAITLSNTYFSGVSGTEDNNLYLTTIPKRNCSGLLKVINSTGIGELSLNIRKDSTGLEFGNWSLSENPTIYMHPVGVLSCAPYGTMSDENDYDFRTTGNFKVDIVLNPQLKNKIKKYWVKCTPVVYESFDDALLPGSFYTTTDYGSLGTKAAGRPLLKPYLKKTGEINGIGISQGAPYDTWTIRDIWNKYGRQDGSNPVYKYMYAPDNYDLIRGDKKLGLKNVFVRVALYMEIERDGKRETIVSSRTYRPKLEWDPLYITRYYNGQSMDYIQYAAANDPLLQEIDTHVWESIDCPDMLNDEETEEVESEKDTD